MGLQLIKKCDIQNVAGTWHKKVITEQYIMSQTRGEMCVLANIMQENPARTKLLYSARTLHVSTGHERWMCFCYRLDARPALQSLTGPAFEAVVQIDLFPSTGQTYGEHGMANNS